MTPERFGELRRLFDQVVELDPVARESVLCERAAADPDLVAELRRLLGADASGLERLQQSIASGLVAGAGSELGPYRLQSLIGTGGMGEVWLAEQAAPLARRVALKMIKAGMDSRAVIARFELERHALARLDHPAIARVIDAGTTPLSRPYFVMEYVDGLPIDQFCDAERMSIPERLRLFITVCRGVQHAHNRGIIHRDLKPSNVLVCRAEGEWVAKIIDFGIARVLNPDDPGEDRLTRLGQPVGTPEYMSPEQRREGEAAIDTRVDVYALGVMLHELLAGRPTRAGGGEGHDELERPSTTLERNPDPETIAAARGTDPVRLAGLLCGDLDWITMKATASDRELRYDSPAELAADLARLLESRPVLARPPTAMYLASRFARRHRLAVALGGAAVIAVLAGVAGVAFGLQRALLAEETARREAATATEALDFVVALFRGAAPMEGGSASATARDIVEEGARRMAVADFSDPLVEARLSQLLGEVFTAVAAFDEALDWLERAHELQVRLLGPDHDNTLLTEQRLAFLYWARGPVESAELIQRRVLEARLRVDGRGHPATLAAASQLASILSRLHRLDEALGLVEDYYQQALQVHGTGHPVTLEFKLMRARLMAQLGRADDVEAEASYLAVVEGRRAALGAAHLNTRAAELTLATHWMRTGRLDEAEALLDHMYDQIRAEFGLGHKAVFRIQGVYGELRARQGRLAEAVELKRATLAGYTELLAPGHPDLRNAEQELARTLELAEDNAEFQAELPRQ